MLQVESVRGNKSLPSAWMMSFWKAEEIKLMNGRGVAEVRQRFMARISERAKESNASER